MVITDTDMRYRQRYVDLIMNEDVKKTFHQTFQDPQRDP